MANVGVQADHGKELSVVGIAGAADNGVVMEVTGAKRFRRFLLMSTANAMDVDVSLDGTNFATAVALTDKESLTPATKVLVTAAGILYELTGSYEVIRVRQAGVGNVANASMICVK